MKVKTAASIRRSYIGDRSRAEGAGFEAIISSACDYYRAIGRADIEKTPEPMKPLGGADRSGRFLACYTKQAQPDYKGVLSGGRAVVFEAKHTDTGPFVVRPRISRASRLFAPDITAGWYRVRSVFIQWPGVLPHSVADLGKT